MKSIKPGLSIVPIVRATATMPVSEVLGTGFFVGTAKRMVLVTAKHVIQSNPIKENERLAFVISRETRIEVRAIKNVVGIEKYDVAICDFDPVPEIVPLSFSGEQPALNDDVFCYEYSSTRFERKPEGGMHISFEPLSHKGNIMRFFKSTFPESVPTPSFVTSFPALQGASGAPVMAATTGKNIFVAGMIVANKESRLLPAQVVKVQDGNEFTEEISYFLPMGKAIDSSLLIDILRASGIELDMVQ